MVKEIMRLVDMTTAKTTISTPEKIGMIIRSEANLITNAVDRHLHHHIIHKNEVQPWIDKDQNLALIIEVFMRTLVEEVDHMDEEGLE